MPTKTGVIAHAGGKPLFEKWGGHGRPSRYASYATATIPQSLLDDKKKLKLVIPYLSFKANCCSGNVVCHRVDLFLFHTQLPNPLSNSSMTSLLGSLPAPSILPLFLVLSPSLSLLPTYSQTRLSNVHSKTSIAAALLDVSLGSLISWSLNWIYFTLASLLDWFLLLQANLPCMW